MSTEANKAIVSRLWEEVWNQNSLNVCDEIFDTEYAAHEKGFVPVLRAAFPDLYFVVEDMIAEGDKVVSRYTITGTHRGEFMGIPATGKPVKLSTIWIHRLAEGRIVEGRHWGEREGGNLSGVWELSCQRYFLEAKMSPQHPNIGIWCLW